MDQNFIQDLELSHGIISFLHASLQGRFASLNLLSQLAYHDFNPESLVSTEKSLQEVEKWKKELLDGLPLFSAQWSSPQTVQAKRAMDFLLESRNDFLRAAAKVQRALSFVELKSHPDEIRLLISEYTRNVYARENYIRSFLEFSAAFNNASMGQYYSGFLAEAQSSLQAAHMFFAIFSGEEEPLPAFYRGLREESLLLPGTFKSQAHDALLLLSSYSQELNAASIEISEEEASEWFDLGVALVQVGYWKAWGFNPEDAMQWIQQGVVDPKTSWFWLLFSFTGDEAIAWMQRGFSAPAANELRAAGQTPETAMADIESKRKEAKEESIERFDLPEPPELD